MRKIPLTFDKKTGIMEIIKTKAMKKLAFFGNAVSKESASAG